MSLVKIIKIKDDLYDELKKLGKMGESFDDVVRKCLASYKRENKLE